MSLPFISCVCVTYARPQFLEEAIACFLAQDYAGQRELVILNTFPQQELTLDAALNVHIFNLGFRPASLGQARNLAIHKAKGDVIVTWDDDDVYLPHHLTMLGQHFVNHAAWVWQDRMYFAEHGQIRSIIQASINVFAFRKTLWEQVDGYEPMNTGEDRVFMQQVTANSAGTKIRTTPKDISFIYGWANGAPHISGHGPDEEGQPTGYQKVADWTAERVKAGKIKTGRINLHPALQHDYARMAERFLTDNHHIGTDEDVCIVQLGRFGDVINILPIALHINNTYAKPFMMVSREFASILDGVSYVTPYLFEGRNEDIVAAVEQARARFKHVLVTQIWGRNLEQDRVCESYNLESWRKAGFYHQFRNTRWKPVFDRINKRAETVLTKTLANCGDPRGFKPLIVVNVTAGISSPFPAGEALLKAIKQEFTMANVVDVSQLVLERYFDMMGLLHEASLIVTIDTSLLHLAAATNTPVLAITNPLQWLGSTPRSEKFVCYNYHEAAADPRLILKGMDELLDCVPNFVNAPRGHLLPIYPTTPPTRRVFHAYEVHSITMPSPRHLTARASWAAANMIGAPLAHYPRNSLTIGDTRALAYVKDILKPAMDLAGDDDIIVLTNDDIYLHRELVPLLKYHVALHDACSSQRCEFKGRAFPLDTHTPEMWARVAEPHMGRDMFAFTKRWLVAHWTQIPDFIAGAPLWDLCLAAMIRIEKGVMSSHNNFQEVIHPCEIPRGYIAHQWHQAVWTLKETPAIAHNRRLFTKWRDTYLPELIMSV